MTWVIEALQPVSFLQIGMMWQLPDGDYGAVTVRSVRSLDEAVGALVQYEFDAIILGSAVMDTWPTAAYEQIAQLAGATPVLVQTYFIGPMTDIKQQQDREQPYCGVVRSPKSQARRSGKHSLPIVASAAPERSTSGGDYCCAR